MSAAWDSVLNAVIARARNSELTMQLFSGKFSCAAASQLLIYSEDFYVVQEILKFQIPPHPSEKLSLVG